MREERGACLSPDGSLPSGAEISFVVAVVFPNGGLDGWLCCWRRRGKGCMLIERDKGTKEGDYAMADGYRKDAANSLCIL